MIYLIRHGQTEGNRDGKFQGHTNYPLTELGIKQASFVSKHFKIKHFDIVFCSSLERCKDTFFHSKQNFTYNEYIETDLLKEMFFGDCEGLSWEEILKRYPPASFLELNTTRFPNGENIPDLLVRANSFKNKYKEDLAKKNILIVTHKLFGNAIKSVLLNNKYHEFDFLSHLSYSEIDFSKKEIFNINLKDLF